MHESGLVQAFKAVVVLHCPQAGLLNGMALRSRVEIQRTHEWVLGWDPSDSFCLQSGGWVMWQSKLRAWGGNKWFT